MSDLLLFLDNHSQNQDTSIYLQSESKQSKKRKKPITRHVHRYNKKFESVSQLKSHVTDERKKCQTMLALMWDIL